MKQPAGLFASLRKRFGKSMKVAGSTSPKTGTLEDITQSNLDQALAALRQGQLDKAESLYKMLLQQQPDHPDALNLLGVVRAQCNDLAGAAELISRATKLAPDNTSAHSNLGNVLKALGKSDQALESYDRALRQDPKDAETLNNRGALLDEMGRVQEALESYDQALVLAPQFVQALFNYGNTLLRLNRYEQALQAFDKALAIQPQLPEVWANRGNVLEALERPEDALKSYTRALVIRPDFAGVLNNRGGLLRKLGAHEKSTTDYEKLIAVDPDFEYARGNKFYSSLLACNWHSFAADRENLFAAVRCGRRATIPFPFLLVSESGTDQLTCNRTYVAHKYPQHETSLWNGECYRHDKIRIAYLSADFHRHATAYLMAELFEKHDNTAFEVSAWSFGSNTRDDMRARLCKSFGQFNDVRAMTDGEAAVKIRKGEIDIAVDLKGFTDGCRTDILARRPAPVQVNYLGYPGSMGANYIDYLVADSIVIPPGHEKFYQEKIVRLPNCYQVNDSKRAISSVTPSRAEVGLPVSGFVFCCFNSNVKINPGIFGIWMRLLKGINGSVLWLLDDNHAARCNLRSEAHARGVSADRLVFAPRIALPDHLARHRLADLFLDTLPCNAHTTTSDALWAGLPVLTCMGDTFAGRVAGSLLRAAGLPELITHSLSDYEALALQLATDPDKLQTLKTKLERNRRTCALFDTDRFRRHIEAAYITMHERQQRGELPAAFDVAVKM